MAKFEFTVGVGFGGNRKEIVEIDDEELSKFDDLSDRDAYIEEQYVEWTGNYIDGGWEEIDVQQITRIKSKN